MVKMFFHRFGGDECSFFRFGGDGSEVSSAACSVFLFRLSSVKILGQSFAPLRPDVGWRLKKRYLHKIVIKS